MGSPSHRERLEVRSSQGNGSSSEFPSLENQVHSLQLECLTLSSVPMEEGLREKGHLESQDRVVSWHLECSLKQLAGAEHRLVQPGVRNQS